MYKKFAPILLIVVLAALAVGLTYWRGQSQEPLLQQTAETVSTADWKTYNNTSKGYSIKYPSTWKEESGFLYSPEMYNAREGGPYSLLVGIESKFASISDMLNNEPACKQNVGHFNVGNSEV